MASPQAWTSALTLALVGASLAAGQQGDTAATGDARSSARREGLAWLARHQAEDGRWDVDGWSARCADPPCAPDGPLASGAEARDVGLAATVVLAYVGAGHTHRFGEFKATVARALRWLRARQADDGSFVGEIVSHRHALDDHALATLALCEAYAVSRDFTLKRDAERALAACLAAQEVDGGWSHGEAGGAGLARTAWFVLALKAGKTCGLGVTPGAFERAHAWLTRHMVPADAARVGPHDGLRCATSLAGLARIFCGERRSTPDLRALAFALARDASGAQPCEAWTTSLLAMQLGGAAWRAWDRPTKDALVALVARVDRAGCATGSLSSTGSCGVGGRVEATAQAVLTLDTWSCWVRAGDE